MDFSDQKIAPVLIAYRKQTRLFEIRIRTDVGVQRLTVPWTLLLQLHFAAQHALEYANSLEESTLS